MPSARIKATCQTLPIVGNALTRTLRPHLAVPTLRPAIIGVLAVLVMGTAPAAAFGRPVQGGIEVIDAIRILRLQGSPAQMGYAHGYLMADEIVQLIEDYMLGTLYDVENYWRTTTMINSFVRVPLAQHLEIMAMYQGLADARGPNGIYSPKLKRNLLPVDLIAWNMVPEIFRLTFNDTSFASAPLQFSSSVSGWGAGAADGALMLARDLDFGYPGDLLDQRSLVIAYQPDCFLQHEWLSIAWPGMIGCLTCMNAEGTGAALDLGNDPPELDDLFIERDGTYVTLPFAYTPITLALRQGIENKRFFLRQAARIEEVYDIVTSIGVAGSFDIHVYALQDLAGARPAYPAAVIECSHRGVALRTAADNQQYEPHLLSDLFLAVTNHHRKLMPPVVCERYTLQVELLNSTERLDMEKAFEIEREVAQDEGPFNTVHMVGFVPATRQIWVSFARDGQRAREVEPVRLAWEDLFE